MTEAQDLLLAVLRQKKQHSPVNQFYANAADFVLRHGIWYLPRAYPAHRRWDIGPFPAAEQYRVSIAHAAMYGWRYVEGYAVTPPADRPAVVLHAWNADNSNALLDSSWNNEGEAYLGVEFSVERADEAVWVGDASVLKDDKRGYPLFQRPWLGEDYSLKFQTTEALALWRAGKWQDANRWLGREIMERRRKL